MHALTEYHTLGPGCSWPYPSMPIQADDRRFKEELGRVVEMDLWDAAKGIAAERLRGARVEAARLGSEAEVRAEVLSRLQGQVSNAGPRLDSRVCACLVPR